MFNKEFGARRKSYNADAYHEQPTAPQKGIYHATIHAQTRRMFNEWEIESRADRRHPNADGSVNVGDDIKINKRRPYGDFYKYGLIK